MANIKCSNCGISNTDDALFCRSCGSKLVKPGPKPPQPKPDNIMDQYPLYHFRPTNLFDWKVPTTGLRLRGLLRLLCFLGLLVAAYFTYAYFNPDVRVNEDYNDDMAQTIYWAYAHDPLGMISGSSWGFKSAYYEAYNWAIDDFHDDCWPGILVGGLAALIFGFFASRLKPNRKPANTPRLSALADYVQNYYYTGLSRAPIYVFIVKDGKWGLINAAAYAELISPAYSHLKWREYGKLITATNADGSQIIVDIFGKKLK